MERPLGLPHVEPAVSHLLAPQSCSNVGSDAFAPFRAVGSEDNSEILLKIYIDTELRSPQSV